MFSISNPATNIEQLLEWLHDKDEDKDTVEYLYRGQTKDYPILVSSGFRSGIVGNEDEVGWIGYSNTQRSQSSSEQQKIRAKVKTTLLQIFGKSIGNLVAQQYGLSSEVIDFSSKLEVAAFFASTRYPEYAHFNGTSENTLGVIHRLRIPKRETSLLHFESTMHLMTLYGYQETDEIFFRDRVAIPAIINQNDQKSIDMLEKYFYKYGQRKDILTTNSMWIKHDEVIQLYSEIGTRAALPKLDGSRVSTQCASFVYPVLQHKCIHPVNIVLEPSYYQNCFYANPSLVAIVDSNAVHNLKKNPNLESYYFKHSSFKGYKTSRENLWPSTANDELRGVVNELSLSVGFEYLKKNEIAIDDPLKGIIDPGYYESSNY